MASPKKKNPRGRPSKYQKKFCKMLIDHMSQGLSFDTFAGVIGVNADTLYHWLNNESYSDFSEAKGIGTAKRNLLVEKAFVSSTLNPGKYKYNTSQMIYWTKNTLGWKDNPTDATAQVGTNITLNYKLDD